jgi:uncharacterized protein (DUF305 family)
MKTSKNIIIGAVVTIVAIAGVGIYALNKNDSKTISNSSQSSDASSLVDKNSADYKTYSELTGEDYDRMFLSNMIAHHQGAVDMANLALTNASHQEVKDLAKAIVTAQTAEITDMTAWQKTWGYPASSGEMMEDHSSMGMMNTNAGMMNELNGKTGDAFDKAFLEHDDNAHHQSCYQYGCDRSTTRAQHRRSKDD